MRDMASKRVAEVMQQEFAALRCGDRLDLVDQIMGLGRIRHLPVQDAAGRVVGIVSQRSLLDASLSRVLDFEPAQRRAFLRSIEVDEVMSQPVETIAPDASLAEAARRMAILKIGCLPVVRPDGVMVGLVTETDLLAAAYGSG